MCMAIMASFLIQNTPEVKAISYDKDWFGTLQIQLVIYSSHNFSNIYYI